MLRIRGKEKGELDLLKGMGGMTAGRRKGNVEKNTNLDPGGGCPTGKTHSKKRRAGWRGGVGGTRGEDLKNLGGKCINQNAIPGGFGKQLPYFHHRGTRTHRDVRGGLLQLSRIWLKGWGIHVGKQSGLGARCPI